MNEDRLRKWILGISIFVLLVLWVRFPRAHVIYSDAQQKLYASYSLVVKHFTSESNIYHGQDFDPDGRFKHLPDTVELEDGRTVSAFPLAFSVLATPFVMIDQHFDHGLEYVSLLNLIPLLIIWWLLFKLKLHPVILASAYWANFLWLQVYEFSEILLAALFAFVGYLLFVKNWPKREEVSSRVFIFAGLISGVAIFFRAEAAVFYAAFTAMAVVISFLKQTNKTQIGSGVLASFWFGIGFVFTVIAWLAWNVFDYGHFLGPRYVINQGGILPGFSEIFSRYVSLLIGLLPSQGLSFGLFLYIPLLFFAMLAPVFGIFEKWKGDHFTEILTWTTILAYLLLVPFIVPNDGYGIGPRYLIYAVLPGYVLIDRLVKQFQRRWISVAALLVSLLSFSIPVFMHKARIYTQKHARSVYLEMIQADADIWIFTPLGTDTYAGLLTIRHENYAIGSDDDLLELLSKLRPARPHKSIAITSTSEAKLKQAEDVLGPRSKDSLPDRQLLDSIRSSHRDVGRIQKVYPDLQIIYGKEIDVLLIPNHLP